MSTNPSTSWLKTVKTPRMMREEKEAFHRDNPSLDTSTADKVGLLVMRGLETDNPQVLFTRVNPKNLGERAHLSIPRETRDVQNPSTGTWLDPRKVDQDTIDWKKESIRPCILRAGEEEAGIPKKMMQDLFIHDLGAHEFVSRKGDRTQVQWYMVNLTDKQVASMQTPKDAVELQWVNCGDLQPLAEYENINPGYLGVIADALKGYRENTLTKFVIPFTEAQLTR